MPPFEVSSKSSWQLSLVAGRISSSPIVKGFLALAMQLATKNDAVSTDTFDEVVAFNNCFCSLCLWFFFWKTPETCVLMHSAWSPCGKAVVKVSWLPWIHILYRADLENVNHLLQWTHNLSRILGVFFKWSFLFVGSLRVSDLSSLDLSPLSKKPYHDVCLFTHFGGG